MPKRNSTSKATDAQPIAKAKPTRVSKRLQTKRSAAKEGAPATATPKSDTQGPLATESPAKPMATRTRTKSNAAKSKAPVASGKENVESPALNCHPARNPPESPIKLKNVAKRDEPTTSSEEVVEESPVLNCHPVRNPPESPIKLTKGRAARPSAPQRKRVSTVNNQATRVKAAARARAKKASIEDKKPTAAGPPETIQAAPTQRDIRAQRRAAVRAAKDVTKGVKGQRDRHEETAALVEPARSEDEHKQDYAEVRDTGANQPEEVNSDNQPALGKDVEKGEVEGEITNEGASQNALKRRHDEEEEDEDLKDEEEVERLSFYDGKDDSDVEDDVGHQAEVPESISMFKKSKSMYKKRKVAHGVRSDGSGSPDDNTPADSASRAEANLETANECEEERQNSTPLHQTPTVADVPQFAPTLDADEIFSRLSAAGYDDDVESIGSNEEVELEYPGEEAQKPPTTRPGTPIPKAGAVGAASASPHSPNLL